MDVKEHKSFTTSSAGIFDSAHNVRVSGAKFSNVAGNSTVNSFSNTFVLVQQESSGVGVRSVILLLILAFLFLLLPFLL